MNIPKNSSDYIGKFIVFFSDEKDPEVLFSSFFAEEAYQQAQELKEKEKKELTVLRVNEPFQSSASMMLAR